MTVMETACETIAHAFAEALDVPAIDWETGFFDLGVDSKMVVRVVSDLRGQWPGVRAVDVFSHPTVRDLAAHLAATHPPAAG
ncbi:acyl carrier protein [Streptomyces sp. XD-27]|uniref:acyl carrier protein n=1 Tax=Streptomyces sp. XD-27 TaxID=3062779 RepID=UPI0026F448F2|nr:acyl carrier protein [Streptomyces sp. XD-27]WKX73979.1 acyl carrier protein [Streptomyces sp. XD-27]